jgi:hypothetical protein
MRSEVEQAREQPRISSAKMKIGKMQQRPHTQS